MVKAQETKATTSVEKKSLECEICEQYHLSKASTSRRLCSLVVVSASQTKFPLVDVKKLAQFYSSLSRLSHPSGIPATSSHGN